MAVLFCPSFYLSRALWLRPNLGSVLRGGDCVRASAHLVMCGGGGRGGRTDHVIVAIVATVSVDYYAP